MKATDRDALLQGDQDVQIQPAIFAPVELRSIGESRRCRLRLNGDDGQSDCAALSRFELIGCGETPPE